MDEKLLEDTKKRIRAEPDKVRLRKAIVEHPFGTIKVAMGGRNFWTRGLESVTTEMSLTVLAYNLKRVLKILGTRGLMEAMARNAPSRAFNGTRMPTRAPWASDIRSMDPK